MNLAAKRIMKEFKDFIPNDLVRMFFFQKFFFLNY